MRATVSLLGASFLFFLVWRNARRERQLQRHLDSVFDQPLIGMALLDLDGNILRVNSALCSMMGYRADEMLKAKGKEFAYSHHRTSDWKLFQQMRAGTRTMYQVEQLYRRKEGTRMWGWLRMCRLSREDGASARVLAMVEDITERKLAEQTLNETKRGLAERTNRLIRVQDEERQLMARELHDDVGQRLSLLVMQLERIGQALPAASPVMGTITETLAGLHELTHDVHELSHQLYSTKLQYIGLKPALRELCRRYAAQDGTQISEALEDVTGLPADVEFCLYRVAQEALNNVHKHSQARQASVQLGTRSDMVILEITDSGIGFETNVAVEGLGIASMRERLRMTGGDLVITSKPGQGTRLGAVVPYGKRAMNDKAA